MRDNETQSKPLDHGHTNIQQHYYFLVFIFELLSKYFQYIPSINYKCSLMFFFIIILQYTQYCSELSVFVIFKHFYLGWGVIIVAYY